MSILHRMIRIIVLVLLLISGALVTGAAFIPGLRWELIRIIQMERLYTIYAGLTLFVTGLLFALTGMRRKTRGQFLYFRNDGGTVSISTDAISDYVMKLMEEFPSIMRMKPKVIPEKGRINMIVNVQIKAGPQINEICGLLQQRIRESLTDGLGISEIGQIEVSVTDIISEHISGRRE